MMVASPGSKNALKQGCTCAVMDNHYGRGFGDPPRFWINGDCPLHGVRSESPEEGTLYYNHEGKGRLEKYTGGRWIPWDGPHSWGCERCRDGFEAHELILGWGCKCDCHVDVLEGVYRGPA